jgi:hypothetical protein
MRATKVISAAAVVVGVLTVGGGTAYADHVHSVETGNGSCVLLAENGGEKYVQLPFATGFPENRQHPLHVLVHLGEAGQHITIGVAGTATDPCLGGDYVND